MDLFSPRCVSTSGVRSYNETQRPAWPPLPAVGLPRFMSTIAPPPLPPNAALANSEGYIDEQIRRTRRSLKLLDLGAGLLTLTIGLLGFVLVGALLDHWIIPGGL